jgi:hypothetical protein
LDGGGGSWTLTCLIGGGVVVGCNKDSAGVEVGVRVVVAEGVQKLLLLLCSPLLNEEEEEEEDWEGTVFAYGVDTGG